jgi:hypothetical protein
VARTGRFVFIALLAGSTAFAFDLGLDRRAIDDAIAIGHSRIDSERVRFHRPYRVVVGQAPVDYVDVVTPFRRVEIEAENKARSGNRTLGQREALELLAAAPDQIDFFVELTFHPFNTYIGVPSYGIRLLKAGDATAVEPRSVDVFPRYGPRIEGLPITQPGAPALPNRTESMSGGTAVAHYDARALDRLGVYELVVSEAGKDVGRARMDFRAFR